MVRLPWVAPFSALGPFLESSDNLRALKVVDVYFEDRRFDSFADNMLKISVNKTK